MRTRVYRFPWGRLRLQSDSAAILHAVEKRAGPLAKRSSHPLANDFTFVLHYRAPDQPCPLPQDATLIYENEIFPGVSLEYFSSAKGWVFRTAGPDVVIADYERNSAQGFSSTSCRGWEGEYVFGCVVLPPLIEWLSRKNMYAFHGGAIALGDDGIVLFGSRANGKTTAVLALTFGGFQFVTDDIGLLVASGGKLSVIGMPEPINICSDAPDLFERLALLKPEFAGRSKKTFSIERVIGAPPKMCCIPRMIVFPEVRPDQETCLTPIPRGEAVELLLPNCLFLTGMIEGKDRFLAFLRLVEETRPVRLVLGKRLERLPGMFREALSA